MRGRGEVIVILKMWIIWRSNPCLPEVEESRQSLHNSDPYVRRHGAIRHL
ncbi:unnamed protein product [Brassica oleracea]